MNRPRTGRRAGNMERPTAGFTLLEMTLTLLLVSLALLLAASMLEHSIRLGDAAERQLLDPEGELALRTLRFDVQQAAAVTASGGLQLLGWSEAALELRGHPSGSIVYLLADGMLHRRVYDPAGQLTAERVVMHDLDVFSWRMAAASLLDVHLVWRRASEGLGRHAPRSTTERQTVRLALRGGRGGRGW